MIDRGGFFQVRFDEEHLRRSGSKGSSTILREENLHRYFKDDGADAKSEKQMETRIISTKDFWFSVPKFSISVSHILDIHS
ncbi:predicted protein [Botrytis cinerea T4]|uniref:Uncharacterized protein n=1 Tax=Botryotinia fuckeliana (strain T4) TaxID=999810 RepID=G2YS72_BOTF4|nr:predicted protein [Botrytis cinerea T4]